MMNLRVLAVFWLFLGFCLPGWGQSRKGDLEGIERHRKVPAGPPVLSSLDGDTSSGVRSSESARIWHLGGSGGTGAADAVEDVVEGASLSAAAVHDDALLPYSPALEKFIVDFISNNSVMLGRAISRFLHCEGKFSAVFSKAGVPESLCCLAIVESAMDPLAVSHAGAVGIWQFMSDTARDFGLECSPVIDERLDMDRATAAAARYLAHAYGILGSWPLAVASYNCGILRVQEAVSKAGSTDFWDVAPFLPNETRQYVPALAAVAFAVGHRDALGLRITRYSPDVVVYSVDWDMPFAQLHAATGITGDEFFRHNPQYLSGLVPGKDRKRLIRLPRKYARLYTDNIHVVDY